MSIVESVKNSNSQVNYTEEKEKPEAQSMSANEELVSLKEAE